MTVDDYKNFRISSIQKNSPDLWMFFDGVCSYMNDTQEDLSCRRWQHTLEIAYFISNSDTSKFTCTPGKMATSGSSEYRDHHSDEGTEFFLNRATRISREEYESLRASSDDISENYKKSLRSAFSNIFHLDSAADILEEDYLLLKPIKYNSLYHDQIAVLTQLKKIEGYYLFEFNQ